MRACVHVLHKCERRSSEEGICQRVWSCSGQLQWRAAGAVPFMVNADGARRDAKAITDGWGVGGRRGRIGWRGRREEMSQ